MAGSAFLGSSPTDAAIGNVDRLRVGQPEYHETAVYSESTTKSRPPATRPDRVNWDRLPTVLRNGPYRFFFYSADRDEPAHVHVERDDASAKFWLEPVRFEGSRGFGRGEIQRLERLVADSAVDLLRSWNEYFGD
jgi:hypothetical protein